MNIIRRLMRPEQVRELVLVFLIILLVLFFGSMIPDYYDGRTFIRVSTSVAIIAVVAMGETLVILTRNLDISVGSIVGFTAYFVGMQLVRHNDLSPALAILLSIGLGAGMGLLNGLLVSYGRVASILVTLGTLAIYRGILVQYSESKTVTAYSLPEWVVNLSSRNLFSIGGLDFRLLVGIALLVLVVFHLVLTYLPFGRRLYAIGCNPEAARIAGFPSQRIVLIAYVLCGSLAGLAGFMYLARFSNITVVAASGMEMSALAAVVVGGVSMFGGSGTLIGAFLGATLIGLLEQSLIRWLVISEFWRRAVLGFLILLAVTSDAAIMNRVRNLWTRGDARQAPTKSDNP